MAKCQEDTAKHCVSFAQRSIGCWPVLTIEWRKCRWIITGNKPEMVIIACCLMDSAFWMCTTEKPQPNYNHGIKWVICCSHQQSMWNVQANLVKTMRVTCDNIARGQHPIFNKHWQKAMANLLEII